MTAYAGLDPRIDRSGDGVKHLGISKRGRREIRAILYPVALAALSSNPVIKEFYAKLRAGGKNHFKAITACMRKILHIAYACWISNHDFDPIRDAEIKENKEIPEQEANSPKVEKLKINESFSAPITRREVKKRKAAAVSHRK